jgi:hypothetical protein
MNINELESYKLSDAVKFHTELNPMLFTDQHMESDVREKLLEIANEFIDYLGINNLDIDDITVSGSNAAYTYTDHSDVDLHILVDMNKINNDAVYRELFIAKKNLFNDNHNIKIRGYDVELYVQDKNKPVKSLGEYSILNDKWIKFPRKQRASIDQNSVKNKVTKLVQLAEIANRSNNIDQIDKVLNTIKRYRQSGLDKHGEFGPENIAFKILRTNGIIDKLYNHRNRLYSIQLSLDEDVNEGAMKDVYGEIQDEHWDGIVGYVINGLKKGISEERIELYLYKWAGKELFDLDEELEGRGFGSLSELVNHIEEHDGKYVNPTFDLDSLFGDDQENLSEASGYIPSESEKNDPRFKTALTVDVHPNTMKKNAAKLGWKIARNGRPPLLRK